MLSSPGTEICCNMFYQYKNIMMYRVFAISLLLTCMSGSLIADVIIEGKTTEVTVYRKSARETKEATVNLLPGTQEVIITNVPAQLDVNSLQVGVKGAISLQSATTRVNYLKTKDKTELVRKWEDSLELISNDLKWIQEQRTVYQNEESTLNVNARQTAQQEWLKAEDLLKLTDLLRSRGLDIKKKQFDLGKEEIKLTEISDRIQGQLNEWNNNTKSAITEIVLKVDVKTAGLSSFRCTYKIQEAGWAPIYDIRAAQGEKPVSLEYKAKVYQNTGYNWQNVLLTISSGNPDRDQNRPILNPIFIDFSSPVYYNSRAASAPMQLMEKSNLALDVARDVQFEEDRFEYGMVASEYNVTVSDNAMNIEFAIENKQEIPTGNKEHLVNLQSLQLPATYTYHTVPRKQNSAYLLARITDYGKYNLLPAMANIFYGDMFVGQTQVNPATTADTMLVSLGIDDKITVKRTQLMDYTSKKVLSNNKKDTYGYEMLLRNNKSYEINLEVLDQLPISKNKDIQVELIESNGAEYSSDYGRLLWKFKLGPSETRKIKLVYAITYPKDKTIFEYN